MTSPHQLQSSRGPVQGPQKVAVHLQPLQLGILGKLCGGGVLSTIDCDNVACFA